MQPVPIGPNQLELRNVVAERAGDVVVLAVDVVGDGAADGDVLGARGDGEEEAERNGEVEDFRKQNTGFAPQDPRRGVEVEHVVHAARVEQGAVLEQANVAIGAAGAYRQHGTAGGFARWEVGGPGEGAQVCGQLGVASPGLKRGLRGGFFA